MAVPSLVEAYVVFLLSTYTASTTVSSNALKEIDVTFSGIVMDALPSIMGNDFTT